MKNIRSLSRKIIVTLAVILSVFTISMVRAQPEADKKESREKVKAYLEANVLPVLRTQRQKLEAALTDEEKQQISTLREQMKTLRKEGKENRTGRDHTREAERTEAEKASMKAEREERRQLMSKVTAIADRHEETIESLLAGIEEQQQQWKTDIRAIMEASGTERAQDARPGRHERGRRFNAWHVDHPASFLLLDPNAKTLEEMGGSHSNLYPNPVNGESVLEYQLEEKGPVIITVFDDEGLPVKSLVYEIQDKGQYKVSMEADDLKAGTYIYLLSTAKGTETSRFIKL